MYYDKKTILFMNGNWEKAVDSKGDLYSQTLHYGNGVFEGIRSYETPGGAQIFKAREQSQDPTTRNTNLKAIRTKGPQSLRRR